MNEFTIGILGAFALVVMVFLGVRVCIAAAAVGLAGLVAMIGWDSGAGMAGTIPHSKSVTYTLSVLPMFILIGFLAFHAGLTEKLFDAATKWLGCVPGGLAVATVMAATGFAAVSGASTATAAVFSRVAIPDMLKAGYDKRLAAGVVAAGGTPATLFVAAFLPGTVSPLIYMALIVLMAKLNPNLGRPIRGFTWTQRWKSVPGTFPIIAVVLIIFSAMYFGWATPTEPGALGAFVVFVLALVQGMRWRGLQDALLESAKLTVMIFSIIWGVLIFVRFLGFAGLPEAFAQWVVSLDVPPIMVMICILLFYVILGMFMDAIGMLLLTLPVVYPAVIALGYDPIWFGIVVVKMAEICLITPPIGLNCFVVNGVRPDIPLTTVFRGIMPFFVADVVTVGLFLAFPQIILCVPQLMRG